MRNKKWTRALVLAVFTAALFAMQVNAGEWVKQGQYWQYQLPDGQLQKNSWLQTEDQRWYLFDQDGNMKTGWYLDQNQKWYYLDPDGTMACGWRLVDGVWYYLSSPSGEMLVNTTTPDGYLVGANGAWTNSASTFKPSSGGGSGGSSGGGSGNTWYPGTGNNGNGDNGNEELPSGEDNQGESQQKTVPSYVGIIDAVSGATQINIVEHKEIYAGELVSVELATPDDNDYHQALQTIEVTKDGQLIKTYSSTDWQDESILSINVCSEPGNYQITLKANQYYDKVLTVTALERSGEIGEAGLFNIEKCGIFNIEQVHYGVIAFYTGTADDYQLYLNDEPLSVSPVNDQNTIVKFEFDPNQQAVVRAVARADEELTQTIIMGDGQAEFSGQLVDQDPEYVLASGPISVYDYYLDNYDEDGNVRKNPTKSTFDTEPSQGSENGFGIPVLSSQKARIGTDVSIQFETGGSASQWQNGIYEVLKDYGTGAGSRQPLIFSVRDGEIIISADSPAIEGRNGKHSIIIRSNGYDDARITVEIVRPAGQLQLSGDFNWWSDQDLLFELTDFNYAITNPIYAVYLDGTLLTGDCHHYHVVSNLVRLERECHQLLTPGIHTLVVKAEGFEDYQKVFRLEPPLNGQQNPVWGEEHADDESRSAVQRSGGFEQIDALSGATSGGSSESGGSSGSGGPVVRGNIVFEFDLLANARILKALGMETEASEAIISWWNSLTKDAVITLDGQEKLIDYTYFKNHCGQPYEGDDYLTFRELYEMTPEAPENLFEEDAHPALYLDRPYQVKNMLEDGLLGETYNFTDAVAKPSPVLTAPTAYAGADLVIYYSETEDHQQWAESVTQVMLRGYRPVTDYQIDAENRRIIIPNTAENQIGLGEISVTVYADTYESRSVTVTVERQNENELQAEINERDQVVITGFTEIYAAAINGVQLNGRQLLNSSQTGDTADYQVNSTSLILSAELFTDTADQQQTLMIYAADYSVVTYQFVPAELGRNEEIRIAVPSYVVLHQDNRYETNEAVTIVVGEVFADGYEEYITAVKVNDEEVENSNTGWDDSRYEIAGSYFAVPGDYTITIEADGYYDKEFSITINEVTGRAVPNGVGIDNSATGTGVINQKTIAPGQTVTIKLGSFFDTEAVRYQEAFEKVEISNDGDPVAEYLKAELEMSSFSDSFVLSEFAEPGSYQVILSASGYQQKIVTVTVEEPEEEIPGQNQVPDYVGIDNSAYGGVLDEKEIDAGQTITIKLGSFINSEYKELFQSVKVLKDGAEIAEYQVEQLGIGSYSYTFTLTEFDEAGDYLVILSAEGYDDKELTVSVSELQESQQFSFDGRFTRKSAVVSSEEQPESDYNSDIKFNNFKINNYR